MCSGVCVCVCRYRPISLSSCLAHFLVACYSFCSKHYWYDWQRWIAFSSSCLLFSFLYFPFIHSRSSFRSFKFALHFVLFRFSLRKSFLSFQYHTPNNFSSHRIKSITFCHTDKKNRGVATQADLFMIHIVRSRDLLVFISEIAASTKINDFYFAFCIHLRILCPFQLNYLPIIFFLVVLPKSHSSFTDFSFAAMKYQQYLMCRIK